VLTEFRSTVPELFAVGKEVLVFHDFDDLVDQATRLLGERGLTARLGNAATQRAHRDHTYDLRVTAILEKLALPFWSTRMRTLQGGRATARRLLETHREHSRIEQLVVGKY
jgi:spore maturation protein CgeB